MAYRIDRACLRYKSHRFVLFYSKAYPLSDDRAEAEVWFSSFPSVWYARGAVTIFESKIVLQVACFFFCIVNVVCSIEASLRVRKDSIHHAYAYVYVQLAVDQFYSLRFKVEKSYRDFTNDPALVHHS